MKNSLKLNICILLLAALGMASCGDDGVNGIDGLKGADGKNGVDGTDGATLEPLKRDGYINMVITGTVDEQPFKETVSFAYSGVGSNPDYWSNRYERLGSTYYYVKRCASPSLEGQMVALELMASGDPLEVTGAYVQLQGQFIIGNKIFNLQTTNYGASASSITNYSYDAVKRKLAYKFDITIPGAGNNTGNDLVLTGDASVTLYNGEY